jgi:hypothetical protein
VADQRPSIAVSKAAPTHNNRSEFDLPQRLTFAEFKEKEQDKQKSNLLKQAQDTIINRIKHKNNDNKNKNCEEFDAELIQKILNCVGENEKLNNVEGVKSKIREFYEKKKAIRINLIKELDALGNERPTMLRLKQKYIHNTLSTIQNYYYTHTTEDISTFWN